MTEQIGRMMEISEQGWRARERGECRESNPFACACGRESEAFTWWDSGWVGAEDEIQMDREYYRWEDISND